MHENTLERESGYRRPEPPRDVFSTLAYRMMEGAGRMPQVISAPVIPPPPPVTHLAAPSHGGHDDLEVSDDTSATAADLYPPMQTTRLTIETTVAPLVKEEELPSVLPMGAATPTDSSMNGLSSTGNSPDKHGKGGGGFGMKRRLGGEGDVDDGVETDARRSKYKGVCWYRQRSKWEAHMYLFGRKRHIGYFDEEIEAAKAYDRAVIEAHGPTAVTNFDLETGQWNPRAKRKGGGARHTSNGGRGGGGNGRAKGSFAPTDDYVSESPIKVSAASPGGRRGGKEGRGPRKGHKREQGLEQAAMAVDPDLQDIAPLPQLPQVQPTLAMPPMPSVGAMSGLALPAPIPSYIDTLAKEGGVDAALEALGLDKRHGVQLDTMINRLNKFKLQEMRPGSTSSSGGGASKQGGKGSQQGDAVLTNGLNNGWDSTQAAERYCNDDWGATSLADLEADDRSRGSLKRRRRERRLPDMEYTYAASSDGGEDVGDSGDDDGEEDDYGARKPSALALGDGGTHAPLTPRTAHTSSLLDMTAPMPPLARVGSTSSIQALSSGGGLFSSGDVGGLAGLRGLTDVPQLSRTTSASSNSAAGVPLSTSLRTGSYDSINLNTSCLSSSTAAAPSPPFVNGVSTTDCLAVSTRVAAPAFLNSVDDRTTRAQPPPPQPPIPPPPRVTLDPPPQTSQPQSQHPQQQQPPSSAAQPPPLHCTALPPPSREIPDWCYVPFRVRQEPPLAQPLQHQSDEPWDNATADLMTVASLLMAKLREEAEEDRKVLYSRAISAVAKGGQAVRVLIGGAVAGSFTQWDIRGSKTDQEELIRMLMQATQAGTFD